MSNVVQVMRLYSVYASVSVEVCRIERQMTAFESSKITS